MALILELQIALSLRSGPQQIKLTGCVTAGELSQQHHDQIFNDCWRDRYFALLRILQNLGLLTNAETGSVKQTMWNPKQGLFVYHVVLAAQGKIEVREVQALLHFLISSLRWPCVAIAQIWAFASLLTSILDANSYC